MEKLLQVIISFSLGGYHAYTKKSNLLKYNTEQYNAAIEFIKGTNVTIDTLVDLYLLYRKADVNKSNSSENRFPIPYYLIDAFALYECSNRKPELISNKLNSSELIENTIKLYTIVTKAYTKNIRQSTAIEYNQMIKKPIDYLLLENQREIMIDI
ncbi:MAG: hypothetical protein BWY15_01798 [Firmicutes bacterium ADurb.Bin193]|nr:MAG: hypothetical protein BWY15_01798 [Firmicutes bacterium ADurb.Bin193]